MSCIKNIVYELSHEFSNNLRIRIFRNQEMLREGQNWVEIEPITSLPSRTKNFVITVKIYVEVVIKIFCSCPWFFLLDLNILSKIVVI